MSGTVLRFDADTQGFRKGMQDASDATDKFGDKVSIAKQKILDAAQAQIDAAAKMGASQKELERIASKAASRMASVTESNATKTINSLNSVVEHSKKAAAELSKLKVPELPATEPTEITNRMRASALLRGGGLRAGENFASQFAIFNKFATFAFPAIGAVVLTDDLVKMGEAAEKTYETAKKIPDTLKQGFESINEPIETNIDELRKSNDEMEITISKLEHKPVNSLAIALDDARIKADQLAKSAESGLAAITNLLQANRVGLLESAMTGQGRTSPAEDEIKKRLTAIRDAEQANRDAIRSGQKPVQDTVALYRSLYEWAHKSRVEIQGFNTNGANNANINILTGVENYAYDQMDLRQQDARNVTDTARMTGDRAAKGAGADANKAAEAKLHAAEQYLTQWQLLGTATERAVYWYWKNQEGSYSKGSSELETVQRNELEIVRKSNERILEMRKKFAEQSKALADLKAPELKQFSMLGNNDSSAEALNRAQAASNLSGVANSAAIAKAKVEIQLATGSIDRMDAAQKLAAIAASEHAARLADINAQIAKLKANGDYNSILDRFGSDKNQQAYTALQSQAAKESTDAQIAQMQEAAKAAAATWQGGLRDAANAWVNAATDISGKLQSILTSSLDSINSELAKMVTGHRTNFRSVFEGTSQNLAKAGIEGIEGNILKAFGLGAHKKADGSKSNPFYTITESKEDAKSSSMSLGKIIGDTKTGISKAHQFFSTLTNKDATDADGNPLSLAGRFGSALNGLGLGKKVSGHPDGSSSNPFHVVMAGASGGSFGGLFGGGSDSGDGGGGGIMSLFGGGKAVGGSVSSSNWYLTGEKGPEIFAPGTSGTIIPAAQTKSMMGGGGGGHVFYTVNVANGVTPSQMDMHVRAALQQYHGTVKQTSIQAVRDHARRVPTTHR